MDPASISKLTDVIFSESHGAFEGHLGAGALYYGLGTMLRARVSVCIGSGGGFVPLLMRRAQQETRLDNACTYLVDANLGELGFGNPMQPGGWLTADSKLATADERLVILQMLSRDAARLFGAAGIQIDYLHIDGDHSTEGVLRDLRDYLPLLSVNSVVTMHDLRLEAVRLALSEIAEKHPELETILFDEVGEGTAVLRPRSTAPRRRLPQSAESLRDPSRSTRIPAHMIGPAVEQSQHKARFERWHYLATRAYQIRYDLVAKAIDSADRAVVELGGFPNSIVDHLAAARSVVAIEPYAPPEYIERVRAAAAQRNVELLLLSNPIASIGPDLIAKPYAFLALGLDVSAGCQTEDDFIAALGNLVTLIGRSEIAAIETSADLPSTLTAELIERVIERRVVVDVALDLSRDPVAQEFFVRDGRAKRRIAIFEPTAVLGEAVRKPLIEACALRLSNLKSGARNTSREYSLGELVLFRSGEESSRFLVSGWSALEPKLVWATGKVSRMEIRVRDQIPESGLVATVACTPFLADGQVTSQRMSIVVNGKRAFKGRLAAGAEITFLVERELIGNAATVRIAIIHPDRARPADVLPNSGDRRELAVQFHSIILKPSPAGAAGTASPAA